MYKKILEQYTDTVNIKKQKKFSKIFRKYSVKNRLERIKILKMAKLINEAMGVKNG